MPLLFIQCPEFHVIYAKRTLTPHKENAFLLTYTNLFSNIRVTTTVHAKWDLQFTFNHWFFTTVTNISSIFNYYALSTSSRTVLCALYLVTGSVFLFAQIQLRRLLMSVVQNKLQDQVISLSLRFNASLIKVGVEAKGKVWNIPEHLKTYLNKAHFNWL